MNEEQLEKTMDEIIDQLGYLLMEMILASFKRINTENYLFVQNNQKNFL
jgi:hypothetical protein